MSRTVGRLLGALAALALAAPAMAQDYGRGRWGDRDGYGRSYRSGSFRAGYDRGFEDGAKEGDKDGRRGKAFDFWNEGRYRDGDHGYHSSYGPKWEYRRGFQRGFEDGYRRAYASRRPDYPYTYRYGRDDGYIYEEPRRY